MNISFSKTIPQINDFSKTVTRRNGWWKLSPGIVLQAVEKGQGLKLGEHVKLLHKIQVLSSRAEPLNALTASPKYGEQEVIKEGFPEMTPDQFVQMYCDLNKCQPSTIVRRIEFRHYITHPLDATIKVPKSIATCPSCKAGLSINPDGWEIASDGTMICDSFTSNCENEPADYEEQACRAFENCHAAEYKMPYIYWLPTQDRLEKWLIDTFRFELLENAERL
jgi:hypothetical protein